MATVRPNHTFFISGGGGSLTTVPCAKDDCPTAIHKPGKFGSKEQASEQYMHDRLAVSYDICSKCGKAGYKYR